MWNRTQDAAQEPHSSGLKRRSLWWPLWNWIPFHTSPYRGYISFPDCEQPMQSEEQRKTEAHIISRVCQEYHQNEEKIRKCTHITFFRLKTRCLTKNKACLIFCWPNVFFVMLTIEIIFSAENFPVNLPHRYKLPVLKCGYSQACKSGRRRADIQQRINWAGCVLKGIF